MKTDKFLTELKNIINEDNTSRKNERNYYFAEDQFVKASTILRTVATNSNALSSSDTAILLKAASILTDNLTKFAAGEAAGTMSDLISLKDIGILPMSFKDFINKYNIKPDATISEIKEIYKKAYNDFVNNTNKKVSKAIGTSFPNSTWDWQIKEGEIYRGGLKNKGGKPVHNVFGGTNYYYELIRNGRPYTQVGSIEEMIDVLKKY